MNFDKIVSNTGPILLLLFGFLAASSVAVSVGAGLFGIVLPDQTLQLVQQVFSVSAGALGGTGAMAVGERAAAKIAAQQVARNAKDSNGSF